VFACCLPSGIEKSLQHPKQVSARAIVDALEGQFFCCALSVLAIALYKNFPLKCSRVFVVLIAAKATAWTIYIYIRCGNSSFCNRQKLVPSA